MQCLVMVKSIEYLIDFCFAIEFLLLDESSKGASSDLECSKYANTRNRLFLCHTTIIYIFQEYVETCLFT